MARGWCEIACVDLAFPEAVNGEKKIAGIRAVLERNSELEDALTDAYERLFEVNKLLGPIL